MLRPTGAYTRQQTKAPLLHIMDCRLFGEMLLSKPVLGCCLLDPWEGISVKMRTFVSKNMHLKIFSAKLRPYFFAAMCDTILHYLEVQSCFKTLHILFASFSGHPNTGTMLVLPFNPNNVTQPQIIVCLRVESWWNWKNIQIKLGHNCHYFAETFSDIFTLMEMF